MQKRPRLYTNNKATSEGFSSESRFVVFLVFVVIASIVWLFLGIKAAEIKPFKFHLELDKNIRNAEITLSDTIIRVQKGKGLSLDAWKSFENQKNTTIIIVGTEMSDNENSIDTKALVCKRFSMREKDDFAVFPSKIAYEKVILQEKVVSLNLQNAILAKDGWEVLGEPKYEFSKLVIRAEKKLAQKISSLDVESQWINPQYGEQELSLLIQKPEGVYIDKKWVTARFKAAPYVSKKMLIPIRIPLHSGELRLLPSQVVLEVKIPLSLLNDIQLKDFSIVVDTSRMGEGQYLDVRLNQCPKNVKVLGISPSKVEYISIQK